MNVHHLCNRAKAMSGIYIAAVLLVVFHSPAELVGVIFGIRPVGTPEIVEIVDVGALSAEHFTEHTLLGHVESAKLEPVIAAVLENHAVFAVLFRKVDEFPALLEVHGRRHFDSSVLTAFKGCFSHGEMMVPVSSDINEVHVGTRANFLVAVRSGINIGRLQAGLAENLLASFGTCGFIITQSDHFHSGNVAETFNGSGAAHAKTHESHAHGFHFGHSQTESGFLSGRTFRAVYDNCALVPMPFRRW